MSCGCNKMRLGNVETNLMSKLGFKQNQASTENRLIRGLLIHKMSYCQLIICLVKLGFAVLL